MVVYGAAITVLSTEQIEALDDSEFLDCASFLGGYSTWSTSQLASLISVATRVGVRILSQIMKRFLFMIGRFI